MPLAVGGCGVGPDQVSEIREKSKKISLKKGIKSPFWALKRGI